MEDGVQNVAPKCQKGHVYYITLVGHLVGVTWDNHLRIYSGWCVLSEVHDERTDGETEDMTADMDERHTCSAVNRRCARRDCHCHWRADTWPL